MTVNSWNSQSQRPQAEKFNSRVISWDNATSQNISQRTGISMPKVEIHQEHLMVLKIFINSCSKCLETSRLGLT